MEILACIEKKQKFVIIDIADYLTDQLYSRSYAKLILNANIIQWYEIKVNLSLGTMNVKYPVKKYHGLSQNNSKHT